MPFGDDLELGGASSFQFPIPVPTADPDAGTQWQVCFNAAYLPLVLGCLLQALQPSTWDTTDESALILAKDRANLLIAQFQAGCKLIIPGMIIEWAGNFLPDGWLYCDGATISRTTYGALFAAIGTAFGAGNGTTTFRLPRLGGRVVVGVGSDGENPAFTMAQQGGEQKHQLTTAEIPSHNHADLGHSHSVGQPLLTGTAVPPPLDAGTQVPLIGSTGTGFANNQAAGGGQVHNNMQPYVALQHIIKY